MRIDLGKQGFIELAPPVMEPVEQIMRMFEAHFEDVQGWDAKPMYFYLFKRDEEDDESPGIGAANMELPGPLYSDPSVHLPMFASIVLEVAHGRIPGPLDGQALIAMLRRMVPNTFYGVGMVNEGWSTPAKLSTEEVQAIENGTAPMPSQRSDRVEIRMVHIATTDGRVAGLVRERGGTPLFGEFGPSINEDGEMSSGPAITGRIPSALRMLCDGLERIVRG